MSEPLLGQQPGLVDLAWAGESAPRVPQSRPVSHS